MLKIMLKKVIGIMCAVPLLAVLSLAPVRILAEEAESGISAGEWGDGSADQEDALSGPAGEASVPGRAAEDSVSGEERSEGMANGSAAGSAGEGEAGTLSYTEDDLYVMAHVLAGECQSYPDEEQPVISGYGERGGVSERPVYVYAGRKLLQGADGEKLGECEEAVRIRERAAGPCDLAVREETGARGVC